MSMHPAVPFIDGAPSILTHRDHHEVTEQLMIHPCCWIYQLIASMPDQLCHVVVKSWIVTPMKVSMHLNTYHVYQQNDAEDSNIKATLNQDNAPGTSVTFFKSWPSVLYPVQRMTSRGVYLEAVLP
eukprot:15364530-Ditylum_brightwellii.AAC.1